MGCYNGFLFVLAYIAAIGFTVGSWGLLIQGIITWKEIKPWWGYSENKDESFILASWICILIAFILSLIATIFLLCCNEINSTFKVLSFISNLLVSASLALTSIVFGETYNKTMCEEAWLKIIEDSQQLNGKWTIERAIKFNEYLNKKGLDSLIKGCNNKTLKLFIFSIIATACKDLLTEISDRMKGDASEGEFP